MINQCNLIKNIGIKLKSFRVQKGLSIKQLSEKSNVSDQTIMNLESGTANNLSLLKLEALSNALNIPIHFFLDIKNNYLDDTSSLVNLINGLIKDGLASVDSKDGKPVLNLNDKFLYNYYKFYLENVTP